MTGREKRRLLTAALGAVLLLCVAALGLFLFLPRAPSRVDLLLAHPWETAAERDALDQVIREFSRLYPWIHVATAAKQGLSWQDRWEPDRAAPDFDVAVWYGPYPAGNAWLLSPTAWTGQLWVLAIRKEVLKDLETGGKTARLASLRAGNMSLQEFVDFLRETKDRGLTPLTVGNSHGWPALIWAQHLSALLGDQRDAAILPAIATDGWPAADSVRRAFGILLEWKKNGWFVPEDWNRGWAEGLQPLVKGTAAMALVSPVLYSAIPPGKRSDLEYVPFPGSRTGKAAWSIGLVQNLVIPRGTAHPREAQELVRYLSSPGITQVLSSRLNRPFFSWIGEATASPAVLPSWYGGPPTAAFQAAAESSVALLGR